MAARKKPDKPEIPCQYGCGRMADGSLNVSYSSFKSSEYSYKEGFSVYIPACLTCIKGAVKVIVKVPPEVTT